MTATPPWLRPHLQRTIAAIDALHHSIMLTGVSGLGKREFAIALAKTLLCGNATPHGVCGQCQDCRLFDAATHPDLHVLITEQETTSGRIGLLGCYSERYQDAIARKKRANPGKVIPVDQIRTLIQRFYQSSHIAKNKVALVLPADRMNTNAANALLKLLEEPPQNSYFILASANPGMLPATIRSRCVLMPMPQPERTVVSQWLTQHGVAEAAQIVAANDNIGPFDLLADIENGVLQQQQENLQQLVGVLTGPVDPVALAATMAKSDITGSLSGLHKLSVGLIKWQSATQAPPWTALSRFNPALVSPLKLHAVYDKIGQYRRIAREQLNPQLALEEILISMQQMMSGVTDNSITETL